MTVLFSRLREAKGFIDAAGFAFVVHQRPRIDLIDQDVFDGRIDPYIFLTDLRTGVGDALPLLQAASLPVFWPPVH